MILFVFALLLIIQHILNLPAAKKYKKYKARTKEHQPDTDADDAKTHPRNRKKPEWVVLEVIRLRALSPKLGCEKIAGVFNRMYLHTRNMSVSKGTVYNITTRNKYAIFLMRKKIKHNKPAMLPNNLVWSIDLTTITDYEKKTRCIFGVIDSGSRACLLLKNIMDKRSITLLRELRVIFKYYGKPAKIRMDNEAVFKSRLFQFVLWAQGIKQEFTDVACPWMNGRIERLFGTLKSSIKDILVNSLTFEDHLKEFRFWYNHVRTHNNLGGKTPAEAWGKTSHNKQGNAFYVSLCNGELTGFYIPPE